MIIFTTIGFRSAMPIVIKKVESALLLQHSLKNPEKK